MEHDSIGVFLSYSHADVQIAREVRRCLSQISDRLNVFLDHAALQGGDEYENKIAKAIKESTWFIFLAVGDLSSKDLTWCFYEAGQFRAKLIPGEESRDRVTDRMCVLYDEDPPPRQTAKYQATKISAQDNAGRPIELDRNKSTFNEVQLESTGIYQLLTNIVQRSASTPLRDLGDVGVVSSLLRECSRAIIEVILRSRKDIKLPEVSLQPRISFTLPVAPKEGFSAIDPNTEVCGYDNALTSIFQIAGAKTTWGDFMSAALLPNGAVPLWLEDLERSMCKHVALGKVPPQTDMMCVSGGTMYRPVITRFVPYQSGIRDVYVIFSPVQRRPLVGIGARRTSFGIAERIGVLLLSLIMAVRFRQRVLPLVESIESDTQDSSATLLRIEREIGSIESEAQEYGFAIAADAFDAQQSNLVDAMSDEEDRRTVRKFLQEYVPIRTEIVKQVQDVRNVETPTLAQDVRAKIADRLRRLRELNGPFISLLVKELGKQQAEILHE
jgi:TIR domain